MLFRSCGVCDFQLRQLESFKAVGNLFPDFKRRDAPYRVCSALDGTQFSGGGRLFCNVCTDFPFCMAVAVYRMENQTEKDECKAEVRKRKLLCSGIF